MPNRLNVPTELEALVEKREREHRRQKDRERAARKEKEDYLDLNFVEQDSVPTPPAVASVERRKKPGRRLEDQGD